ncbi:exodeoxyribonuclease V subunit gamma [Spiribacter sp. C176]|uniref:RecBCD enzyme subunit RecC n=1 Tax=Spiribacter salilacus TaxID=2664894 RepID=A0A6N7QP01_9GAMM|nr:exodeoxyribonuclease V subunit gamma [Spiribacter salilacus]MRH77762.1 exodeoxyribonuclease V subunit gamma [Spiribacter salilacus]
MSKTGLAVIHSNRMEMLRDVLVTWLTQNPLPPLEQETVLVQSNGMAQWLKLALAAPATAATPGCGIAAGLQTRLPQSFLWQAYRAVLGSDLIPEKSPFEKQRLQWRIFRLLPELLKTDPAVFAPLTQFLKTDPDQRKQHQLAYHLADLYDQYQVYRPDWLIDWSKGMTQDLEADQQWQAALWAALNEEITATGGTLSRPAIQQQFIAQLNQAEPGEFSALPRRLVVFGITSLPRPVLEALHALSNHCQILQFVQNPSNQYWADLVEERELLKVATPRHPRKSGTVSHPLLAAWGKQGSDFIQLLEQYDTPEAYRGQFETIDPFDPPVSEHKDRQTMPLLTQIQQDIFDLTPLPEPDKKRPLNTDRSIRFHRAHSRQREVEILHDRLLDAFEHAQSKGKPLRPRDIIVMVPDIDRYAPAIEAVFGTLEPTDPRYIPYSIGDRRTRAEAPIAAAFEKLTDLPNARLTLGEVLDLLEVPAFRQKFGLQEHDLPILKRWCEDAGIRWGLDSTQRQAANLNAAFEQNAWRFGLQRMLLGYAVGAGQAWEGIEPYSEIGSLDAALLGPLKQLLDTLDTHLTAFRQPGRPLEWVQRIEALLSDCFDLQNTEALELEGRVVSAMQNWLTACDEAEFNDAIPLTIARDSWLKALEEEGPAQRFLAGRVNICTLMPMRSIPFRIVCLLGMNDRDYPRTQAPLDFDLMAISKKRRAGDRSRRDDDRYLFLEALLSAREHLHISWVGRSARDNTVQPPSVLVSQLQDHIDRGWKIDHPLIVDHPLQPFSSRYTNQDEYFTYADEWQVGADDQANNRPLPQPTLSAAQSVSMGNLHHFLRNTAAHFFSERLKLRFDEAGNSLPEHEPFDLDGLDSYAIQNALLMPLQGQHLPDQPADAIEAAGQRLLRSGQLPIANLGRLTLKNLRSQALCAAERWQTVRQEYPNPKPPQELNLSRCINSTVFIIEDWTDGLFCNADGQLARLVLKAGDVTKGKNPHYPKLINDWVQHLVLNASGLNVSSWIVGHNGKHHLLPMPIDTALNHLDSILQAWIVGLEQPLPLPIRTVFAYLSQTAPLTLTEEALAKTYESGPKNTGEVDYADSGAWRRSFPTAAALLQPKMNEQTLLAFWGERLFQPLIDNLNTEGAKHG